MCETCFLIKKKLSEKIFQILKFLPYRKSELVKIFEKRGRKFFCVFSALINVKMCETCFLIKKKLSEKIFQFLKFLPYRRSELVNIFKKWSRKFFLRFSALINVKMCETCFLIKKKLSQKNFSNFEIFAL